jgi:hypothetical protein
MKIAFDLDGVLYPWHQVVWDTYFREKYPDIPYNLFWKDTHLSVPEEVWETIIPKPNLYTAPARADIVQMLHRIARDKFIVYVTLRPENLTRVTQRWLLKNGFPTPGECYVVESKVKACQKLGVDLVIEDRVDIMNDLADNDINVLGVRRPWNEDRIGDFPHVDNVLQLEREIARIETAQKVHRRRNGNG